MGQQQLILLALAVVIVGGAIVVGIRAFNENSVKSNADAMMQDAVRIANDAQAWKQKPEPFGGQRATDCPAPCATNDFNGASLVRLGYADPGTGYQNLNGLFTLVAAGTGVTITGVNANFGNTVVVDVCGLSDVNVSGAITVIGNQATGDVTNCIP